MFQRGIKSYIYLYITNLKVVIAVNIAYLIFDYA